MSWPLAAWPASSRSARVTRLMQCAAAALMRLHAPQPDLSSAQLGSQSNSCGNSLIYAAAIGKQHYTMRTLYVSDTRGGA